MTEDQAEKIHRRSYETLTAYVATQKTERQILMAEHHRAHLVTNHDYFVGYLVRGTKYHICRCCGMITLEGTFVERTQRELEERQMCFHCNHWRKFAEEKDPRVLVVDGSVYTDGGKMPAGGAGLGFGGATWIIERDGQVWETNNLWHGGDIPFEWRQALPDNARFINQGLYYAKKDTPYFLKYQLVINGRANTATRYYAEERERDEYAAYLALCGTSVTTGKI